MAFNCVTCSASDTLNQKRSGHYTHWHTHRVNTHTHTQVCTHSDSLSKAAGMQTLAGMCPNTRVYALRDNNRRTKKKYMTACFYWPTIWQINFYLMRCAHSAVFTFYRNCVALHWFLVLQFITWWSLGHLIFSNIIDLTDNIGWVQKKLIDLNNNTFVFCRAALQCITSNESWYDIWYVTQKQS